MILIATALHCEAKPLVKHFNLKKDTGITKFDVYSGDDMSLIVSGTGMLKSAVAVAYLLAVNQDKKDISVFNVGICGAVSKDMEIGTPVLPNKIINSATGRAYYPDMLVKHDFDEGTLESFSRPVTADNLTDKGIDFVDMEAAGFAEAAAAFLAPSRICCFKIVSDHLDKTRLEPGFVSELIQKSVFRFEDFIIKSTKVLNASQSDIMTSEDCKLVDSISENLKLSVSLKHQFKNLARQYKIRYGKDLDCLVPFLEIRVKSKFEGKGVFERIRKLLVG